VPLASPGAAALRRAVIEPVPDGSWDDEAAAHDGGSLALAPGALLLAGDGVAPAPASREAEPGLRGTVTGTGFQRGRVELTIEVVGVGHVTVHPSASTRLSIGSVVELTVDPAAVARVR
jgi:hypothetical protein